MGSLFGGYLSRQNDVWLIDVDRSKVDVIRNGGVTIREPDAESVFHPNAVSDASGLGPMDVMIVFVKALRSREALETNRHLIGETTFLMSLQNGASHEDTMLDFVPRERVILGTTQHNSSQIAPGKIHHGGGGKTFIGLLDAGSAALTDSAALDPIAEAFRRCGFDTTVSADIRKQIWKKLFLNASASAMTAILQVKLGYLADNAHAWELTKRLIGEAVAVANAEKHDFEAEQIAAEIKAVLVNAREGYTSIYADIRDGNRTEVDTVSGSVVGKARRLGVPVPNLEFVVDLIHAMEERPRG
jgi:2-dehydropantoate 2-reductase